MGLHLATFRFDVTPPMGHSLCGGWIKPVVGVDDPLEAIGIVLLGEEAPIVICAVDWCGILNDAHIAWREALAEAAHTTPDRVAVHAVHQHNAPFVCLESERLVSAAGDLPHVVDMKFFGECLQRGGEAVKESLGRTRPVSHLAYGTAKVEQVASNRRLLGPDGKVQHSRTSACKDEKIRALPEGLIDPILRTVSFHDGDQKLAALSYYATHPMSYYGDGRVSSDFVGLARKRRQREEPAATHIYFTGCSGNVTAGKYNDGSPQARVELTDRMHQALVRSEEKPTRQTIGPVAWKTSEVFLPARESTVNLESMVTRKDESLANRIRPAMELSWHRREEAREKPIVISSLHLGDVSLLHLPAECFVEYQLWAQQTHPDRFVATAAYGDGGPWYVPIEKAYPQGGYEVSVAFCSPGVDGQLREAIQQVLG